MKIEDFAKQFPKKLKELNDFVNSEDILDILGVEAVNHFKGSFDNEGFTDDTLNPWKNVKRRDSDSPWYGHSGQTGRFSTARTTAKVLTGETRELQNSITYTRIPAGARISSDKPYAAVHQFGGMAKIYGKKQFNMTPRPFIGKSKLLVDNISNKIKREFKRILSPFK